MTSIPVLNVLRSISFLNNKKREELLVCSDYLLVGRLVLLLVGAVEAVVVAVVADDVLAGVAKLVTY